MAFEYEILTEEQKAEYPELKEDMPYAWYIDKERNIAISGGPQATHWMEMSYGNYNWSFILGINNQWFRLVLEPTPNVTNYKESPYTISWEEPKSIESLNSSDMLEGQIISIFKEAMQVWGRGYENNQSFPNFIVKFNF